jgi:hypothetical protein
MLGVMSTVHEPTSNEDSFTLLDDVSLMSNSVVRRNVAKQSQFNARMHDSCCFEAAT